MGKKQKINKKMVQIYETRREDLGCHCRFIPKEQINQKNGAEKKFTEKKSGHVIIE